MPGIVRQGKLSLCVTSGDIGLRIGLSLVLHSFLLFRQRESGKEAIHHGRRLGLNSSSLTPLAMTTITAWKGRQLASGQRPHLLTRHPLVSPELSRILWRRMPSTLELR